MWSIRRSCRKSVERGCFFHPFLGKIGHFTLLEHVLKTTHFKNSHFADTVDLSEQSIVTVDQSELSIESANWWQRNLMYKLKGKVINN